MASKKYKVNNIKTPDPPSQSEIRNTDKNKSGLMISTKTKIVITTISLGLVLVVLFFSLGNTETDDCGVCHNDTEINVLEKPIFTPSEKDLKRAEKYPDHRVYVYEWKENGNFGGSTTDYKFKVLTKDISVHPQWYYRHVSFGYDIAVLRVERDDVHSNIIPVASMTEFNNLNSCDFFTVYGTGLTQYNQYSVNQLLKSDVQQFVDCDKLKNWEDWNNGVLENTFSNLDPDFDSAICTNATVEKQTQTHNGFNQNDPSVPCTGDSGGPLVKDGKLFGMVSYTYSAPPCTTGPFATVFTSAANYKENDWLKVNSDHDFVEDSSDDLLVTSCDQNGRNGRIVNEIREQEPISAVANGIVVTDENEAPFYSRILSCQKVNSLNEAIDCGTCGAAWIGGKTLVTAAHCVDPDFYYESVG